MCFRSPEPAMPWTRVANSSGAMMERISRRKMWLRGSRCGANARREGAHGHAGGHPDEDPESQRETLQRSPHFNFCRSTSKNIWRGGRIRCSAYCVLWQTSVSRSRMGVPTWPSMVRIDALVGTAGDHADPAGFGHQHRTVGEHVRADGREADGGHRRENDGAAGGKRIGRGAGGRADDEAVGLVGAHELLVDVDVEIDHAGDVGLGEDGVVERVVGGDDVARRAPLRRSAACVWPCGARRAGRAPVRETIRPR